MIRLSKLTDYAVVVLAAMAREPGIVLSAHCLSDRTAIPEPTVAKVLKLLTRAAVVTSVRGVSGGYRLERPAESLPITDIIAAIDGPIALTACVEGSHENCPLEGVCSVHGRWTKVNNVLQDSLKRITLADMTSPLQG